jgi:hypothetical protein
VCGSSPSDLLSDKMMLFPFRSCMLQADSEKLRQAWIKAVQTSIATAYREKGDESEVSRSVVSITETVLNVLNLTCNTWSWHPFYGTCFIN